MSKIKVFYAIWAVLILAGVVLLISRHDFSRSNDIYTYGAKSSDGIGKFYMGREISDLVSGHGAIAWLERQDRNETEKPEVLIKELALKPTDVVADIGAGSGYFTFRMAPLLKQGEIYAVEIDDEMIDYLKRAAYQKKLGNIRVHRGTIQDTRLPENSIDIAFMVDAYHEFSHPREMMNSIVTALKPEGRVILVEYEGEDPNNQVKRLHKMTVEQIKKEMGAVGLEWVRTSYELPIQHISIFKKSQ